MSDSTQAQKQIVLLLVVIAVLAAAIVAVLVVQRSGNSVPEPVATEPTAPAGMPPASSQSPATEFDPSVAPVVPAGQTPEQYVNAYYDLCSKGEYESAYPMLPVATQQYYQSAEGFASTLASYQISGYEVAPQVENGDECTVVGTQEAQGMTFPYTWVFAKGEDGSWLVKARQSGAAQ